MTAPDIVRAAPLTDRWRTLAEQLAPDATRFELEYAGEVSQRLDLSMFTNPPQMVLIGRYDSRVQRVVHRPQVTVDGRLALAVRSGRVVGFKGPHYTGPRTEWTDRDGNRIWIDMWDCKDEGAYPRAARYLIYVDGWAEPVNGTAPWLEFKQTDSKGKLLPLWARMPTTMLAKTALSLGLRRSGVENLPADIPVAYEGDGETVTALQAGDTPGPDADPPPPGPGPHEIVADDGTIFTCGCGQQFSSGGAFHRHRVEARHYDDQPPDELYDDSPESRNYDQAQPESYEDPGRPFTEEG